MNARLTYLANKITALRNPRPQFYQRAESGDAGGEGGGKWIWGRSSC